MSKLLAALLACSVVSSTGALAQAPNVGGKYSANAQVEFGPDGRFVTLLQDLTYIDPSGVQWLAPKGWKVDGASIPKIAWSIIGGPFEGKYRDASIIHDVACDKREKPWNSVHEVFYYAMLTSGVDITTAKIMYAAVFHFGPRWTTKNAGGILGGANAPPPPPTLVNPEADFNQLKRTIEIREKSDNPLTLAEVRTFTP